MVKESGLLESFPECQTALQHFQLPQDSSKSSPSNSSTVVGWVVNAVSKECTILHQDTRNPRPEAFSPVYEQEDGLTWQNWSTVLFLLSWRALCLLWAGAPQTHRSAVAQPEEEPCLILGPQQIKPHLFLSGATWVHMCTHTTPTSWVPQPRAGSLSLSHKASQTQ